MIIKKFSKFVFAGGLGFLLTITLTYLFTEVFGIFYLLSYFVVLCMVTLYHFLMNLRHHDGTTLKCSFFTGTLPLWYVKKHHKIWYLSLVKQEKRSVRDKLKLTGPVKTSDPVANAFIKMYALEGIVLPASDAEQFAAQFKKNSKPREIQKFVEISKMI